LASKQFGGVWGIQTVCQAPPQGSVENIVDVETHFSEKHPCDPNHKPFTGKFLRDISSTLEEFFVWGGKKTKKTSGHP